MNTTTRTLFALALLALLAACGNKGPLVRPSQVPAQPASGEMMPVPEELTPVDPAPQDQSVSEPTDDPEADPETPADDGNG